MHLITFIETAPIFNGDLLNFIQDELNYPLSAKQDSIEGSVVIRCVIDSMGLTTNHEVVKGIREDLNDEALRVVKLVKFEQPAMQRGKAIAVEYIIPVKFELLKANNYNAPYFASSDTKQNSTINNDVAESDSGTISNIQKPFPRFKASLSGGYTYRLGITSPDISSDFKSYYKKMKNGYNINIDLSYYFTSHIGIGVKGNMFNTKNSIDIYDVETYEYGKLSDDISIYYVGPFFTMHNFCGRRKQNIFYFNASLGYLRYSDDNIVINDAISIKGNSVGMCADVGYDFGISKSFAIGFQLSLMYGSLYSVNYSINGNEYQWMQLESDSYESLARVNFTIRLSLQSN